MTVQWMFDRADEIVQAVHELIDSLHPPRTPPDRPRVGLFLTIAEQFEAALQLAKAGAGTHSAVHVRSMLEALATMNMLGIDPDYIDQIRYNQLKGQKKFFKDLLSNHDLPVADRASLQTQLDECTVAFDELHRRGLRPKQITETFSDAGLAHFVSAYTMLCSFSHNDLSILAMRHQGDEGMTYMAPIAPEVLQGIFFWSIHTMVVATEPLQRLAQFPDGLFDRVFQDMNNTWEHFLNQAGAG
jgi:Family of unknown function (DUF5677)